VIRFFYLCLLRLHPRKFRQQFAKEMLWIFGQTTRPREIALLFADAFLSVLRQWILRSEHWRQPPNAAASRQTVEGVPTFYITETSILSIGILLNGALLSIAAFGVAAFAIAHGGASGTIRLPRVVIQPADITPAEAMESSPAVSGQDATLRQPLAGGHSFPQIDPTAALAVEGALPFSTPRNSEARVLQLSRTKPSADPRNGSEPVTQPKPSTTQAALLISLLDKNHDGKISRDEIPTSLGGSLRELLDRADLDEDGFVTAEELEQALRSGP
jgi:hypothetical protein